MEYEARKQLRRLMGVGLGLVGLIVLLLAVLGADRDLGTTISIFSTRFLGIFIEAVPFLLLGTLASGLIDSFVSPEDIARLVPRKPVLATFMGSFLGFIFPVCECGVVPVVRRLYTKGLPMSVGITFLLAAPVMNPIVLASTWVAFGPGPILYGRFIMTVVISMLVGLVFAFAGRPQEVLRPASLAPVMGGAGNVQPRAAGAPSGGRKSLKTGLRDALSMAVDEFFEMGRYLVIGTLLAAAMQTLISQDMLMALGRGPVISVIVMQALAFVLSVCSTVDSFLALAFIGTFTTGSILAFLVFGPMVDIKSAMMFAGVFRPKIVVYLIVLPALLTLLISVWLNLNVAF
ncbi:MAG: permease [Aggregatilineales bacterium]